VKEAETDVDKNRRESFFGDRGGTGSGYQVSGNEALQSRRLWRTLRGMASLAEHWNEIRARYLSGEELSAIADDLGLVRMSVAARASRAGLPGIRKQMQTVCKENKIQSLESLSALVRSKLAADAITTIERVDSYDLEGIKDESTREQILGSVAKRSALVFGWSEQGETASISINLLGSMPDRLDSITLSQRVIDTE
jgi:hypothetical protein